MNVLLQKKKKLEQVLELELKKFQEIEEENRQLHIAIHAQNRLKIDLAKEFKHKVDFKTGQLTKIFRCKNVSTDYNQRLDKA